jgi:hypothetical protein
MNVTLEELKAEVLQNPEIRAEYERLRPEFELAETIITARQPGGFRFRLQIPQGGGIAFQRRLNGAQGDNLAAQREPGGLELGVAARPSSQTALGANHGILDQRQQFQPLDFGWVGGKGAIGRGGFGTDGGGSRFGFWHGWFLNLACEIIQAS